MTKKLVDFNVDEMIAQLERVDTRSFSSAEISNLDQKLAQLRKIRANGFETIQLWAEDDE